MTQRHKGVRLPQSILEEIKVRDDTVSHLSKSRGLSRKETRRLERQNTKKRKQQYFSHTAASKSENPVHSRNFTGGPPFKRQRQDNSGNSLRRKPQEDALRSILRKSDEKHLNVEKKLRKEPSNNDNPERTVDIKELRDTEVRDEEEDAYIEMLERKLGMKKKGKGKSLHDPAFADDNLADLLGSLDPGPSRSPEKEWDELSRSMSMNYAVDGDSFSDSSATPNSPAEHAADADSWRGLSPATSEKSGPETELHNEKNEQYILPQRRQQFSSSGDAEEKLLRQMKGLLNRLSELNIGSIIKEIEASYQKWTRHAVTACLTTLILESICIQSTLSDSYIALYGALVASLYKVIGIDFAASFLQQTVSRYEKLYQGIGSGDDTEDAKSCMNLMAFLAELYNFQLIASLLIYDLVRNVLQRGLREFDIELILKVVRNTGAQLHKDDSSALDEIISIVQRKMLTEATDTSFRMKFLVEVLTEIKNKKSKRSTLRSDSETFARLRKFVAGLDKVYQVRSHEPLRMSLEDLRSADARGKWWLVGAAWAGDPLMENASLSAAGKIDDNEEASRLWKMAKKQGMNTDIRRSIFVSLMSSHDYKDACLRLTQLNFNDIQQREFIRVLLHCCGMEKTYNPYYTLIGQDLCSSNYSHKVTLQYCLWDFLRDLGEKEVGGADIARFAEERNGPGKAQIQPTRINNTAYAFGWWISKDAIDITCLKPLNFSHLQPQTKLFLEQLFQALLISTQAASPLVMLKMNTGELGRDRMEIGKVLSKCRRIKTLLQGVIYFFKRDLMKKIASVDERSQPFLSWACQEAIDILHFNNT